MKKSFILITLLLITTTLFAQDPGINWKIFNLDNIPDATFALKPAKFLDGGRIIWLAGHSTSGTYSSVTWRSTDGGETWLRGTSIPVTTSGARFAAIEAVDANIAFLALVNGHIYKTTDAGLTWRDVHSYVAGGNEWFGGIKALSNNVVVAMGDGDVAGHYYVCKSTDLGETWTQIPYDNLPNASAQFSVFTWGTIFDSYGDNLWMALYQTSSQADFPVVRSTDAGLTWDFSKVPSTSRIWGISFTNDQVGMAVNQGGTIFLTTDGGVTWDTLRTAPPALTASPRRTITAVKGKNKFFLFEESDDALLTQRSHSIYQTSDNGKTWIKDFVPLTEMATRTTVDNISISVYDDNLGFAFGRNNIRYKIGDPEIKKNLNIATEVGMQGLVYKPGAILNNGNTIWFCGHEEPSTSSRNTYSFVSTDAGKTFKTGARVTGRTSNIVAYDANIALMATADGWIVRTTDGGSSWTQVFRGGGDNFFNGIQLIGPNVVVAYGDGTSAGNPYFCKSTDKGLTFAEIPREQLPDLGATLYGYQTHGSCTDSYKNYAWFSLYGGSGTYPYVVSTSDYGETWESEQIEITGNTGTSGRIRSLAWPTDKFGMAVSLNNEIFVMENSGNIWYKANHPSVNYPNDTITIRNVTGIPETRTFIAGGVVARSGGIYYAAYISHDLGHSWKQIAAPRDSTTASYIHAGLYFNENMGYALTYGGSPFKLGDEIFYVKELDEGLSVPKAYTLDQNYPNPFNPSTTIRFTLNKREHVKLVIYDALGKEVRTLVDNDISAGVYSLVFDAVGLSSGVYFYTLRVGNAMETKKMVLMK